MTYGSAPVPQHRLMFPALLLATIPAFLFLPALFTGFFAGCKLARSRAAITEAAPFGLSAESLFVLPLVLLPLAIAAAFSLIVSKPSGLRVTTTLLLWMALSGSALYAMSITDPVWFGGKPLPHRCYLT